MLFHSNPKLVSYVTVIAVGGAVQGVDVGIIATVLGQQSFNEFMFPPGTSNVASLTGAIVAVSSAGMVVGSFVTGMMLEKFGRRITFVLSTLFTIGGAIMQATANGVALMIVGRCVAGAAIGIIMPTCPLYISELAKPSQRARFVSIFGVMIAIGFCLANWIGYGCSFAQGDLGWRLSLAMQVPLAALIIFFSVMLPESPRWRTSKTCFLYWRDMTGKSDNTQSLVVQKGRYAQFHSDMRRLYSDEDDEFIQRTQAEIQAQLTLEASLRKKSTLGYALLELFAPKNIGRTATAIIIMQIIVFSGALAIQNYQSLLYASLGFSGQQALLVSGCYGFMGIVGQFINLFFVADRWPRVRTLCEPALLSSLLF